MMQTFLSKEVYEQLISVYGSPLYVYDETILRQRCREIRQLCKDPGFHPQYSVKANANIELLKIIRSEGIHADAMSMGEVVQEEAAGYTKDEIVVCSNNMTPPEMKFAAEHARITILDSLDQLEQYLKTTGVKQAGIRVNPGIGDGHCTKVITGGNTKFGIPLADVPKAQKIAHDFNASITIAHMHVGSQYLDPSNFLQAAEVLLRVIEQWLPEVTEVDFGGGFGVPYHDEKRLDLNAIGKDLDDLIMDFQRRTGRKLSFIVEPGRYLVAECGELIGTVTSIKQNSGTLYAGTDLGFNIMMRHVLYGSTHHIVTTSSSDQTAEYTVVGNICETGDILAEHIKLPTLKPGDQVIVLTTGAYGFSMASQYNGRLRPAEVLHQEDGNFRLVRQRDTFDSLIHQLPSLL
jgi:diaminopimelate decarboxylase